MILLFANLHTDKGIRQYIHFLIIYLIRMTALKNKS